MNAFPTTQKVNFNHGRQTLNMQTYKTVEELRRAHPEVRSWAYIYHIPRGMSLEAIRAATAQAMKKQGQWHCMVYHVGDFIMAPAVTTQTLCICLERIGDNGPCPIHGEGN